MSKLNKILLAITCLFAGDCNAGAFEIQGHRGARGQFPENTLPAFVGAIEGGAHTLELDLMLTADHKIVIYHDFVLNPELCTYLNGRPLKTAPAIANLKLSEIKAIDCGAKQNPLFPRQMVIKGTQIPTLKELFHVIQTHPQAEQVQLNLEIKINPYTPSPRPSRALVAQKIFAEVQASGLKDRVVYTSFDLEVLKEMRQLDPQARLGFIFSTEWLNKKWLVKSENWLPFVIRAASEIRASLVSVEHTLLTAEKVARLHASGLRVIPWTVNDTQRSQELIEMGVDGLITDYPSDFSVINYP